MNTTSMNRWTTLDAQFLDLIRTAPPIQKHRLRRLHEMANDQDGPSGAEYAEELFSLAKDWVSLQQRLDTWRDQYAATGEDGAA